MSKHIATCGHEIDEGIACSVDDGQISSDGSPAISYGVYCDKCVERHFRNGTLDNQELINLLRHTAEAYERMAYLKKRYKDLRDGTIL